MSNPEKIDTRLAANFAIANMFEEGEILAARDFEEIYDKFGLSRKTAASLISLIKVGRFTRETGVPVVRAKHIRTFYYMHPDVKSDPEVTERLKILDYQYKQERTKRR